MMMIWSRRDFALLRATALFLFSLASEPSRIAHGWIQQQVSFPMRPFVETHYYCLMTDYYYYYYTTTRQTRWRVLFSSDKDYDYDEEEKQHLRPRRRRRRRPIRPSRSVVSDGTDVNDAQLVLLLQQRERARHQEEALKDPTLLTPIAFGGSNNNINNRSTTDIHPATQRALTETLGLRNMTEIQAKTWSAARQGQSVLGRSKTGTGKTLAFLLPTLERLVAMDRDDLLLYYRPGRTIGILIVVPTRELAIQIAEEATALLTFHDSSKWNVLTVYGGTKIRGDIAKLNRRIPTILIATPGRLLDHVDATRIRGRKFKDIISETRIVVLDEADRLVESFYKETKQIFSYLPRPEKRQTLLFSATVPKRFKALLDSMLPLNYTHVDCVLESDAKIPVNVRVEQSYVVLPSMDVYIMALVAIIRQAMEDDPDTYKIVVFFPAARLVKFFARFFTIGLQQQIPSSVVMEMHSRMSQSSRSRVRSQFRSSRRGCILFTSDVSARGMDYPDVSLVVQYGAPFEKELYIHRLGRTARAGKQGKGLLVLLPFESSQVSVMCRRMRIPEDVRLANIIQNIPSDGDLIIESARQLVRSGHAKLTASAEGAVLSFVAYYVEYADKTVSGDVILEAAKTFAERAGLATLPALPESLSAKLDQR